MQIIKASVEKQSLVVDDQSTALILHNFVYNINSRASHLGMNQKGIRDRRCGRRFLLAMGGAMVWNPDIYIFLPIWLLDCEAPRIYQLLRSRWILSHLARLRPIERGNVCSGIANPQT